MKHAFALVCAYEVFAIVTGRTPTITAWCSGRWWRAPAVVTGLAVHLALEAERRRLA